MSHDHTFTARPVAIDLLHATLLSFPIACFSLTLITDIAYLKTVNLLWLHFSEWLLFAGLVFGVISALVFLLDYAIRRVRPSWGAVVAGIVVLLLATLNSFIHTADGWTAVMPFGLAVSLLTVVIMMMTAWLARRGARHV